MRAETKAKVVSTSIPLLRSAQKSTRAHFMKELPLQAHHCSDEDLALSENWQFHRPSRRWSRIATNDLPLITKQDVDEGEKRFFEFVAEIFISFRTAPL